MTCREIAGFLSDYLFGELAAPVLEEFERHLSRCENCREYLATYKSAVELGRRAFDDQRNSESAGVPEELVAAILAAAGKRGTQK